MLTGLRTHDRARPESLQPLIAQAFRVTGTLAIVIVLLAAAYAALYLASG